VRPDVAAFGDAVAAWRDDYAQRVREVYGDAPADAAEVELEADRWMTIKRRPEGKLKPFAVARRA
jgi:hypothetical protein